MAPEPAKSDASSSVTSEVPEGGIEFLDGHTRAWVDSNNELVLVRDENDVARFQDACLIYAIDKPHTGLWGLYFPIGSVTGKMVQPRSCRILLRFEDEPLIQEARMHFPTHGVVEIDPDGVPLNKEQITTLVHQALEHEGPWPLVLPLLLDNELSLSPSIERLPQLQPYAFYKTPSHGIRFHANSAHAWADSNGDIVLEFNDQVQRDPKGCVIWPNLLDRGGDPANVTIIAYLHRNNGPHLVFITGNIEQTTILSSTDCYPTESKWKPVAATENSKLLTLEEQWALLKLAEEHTEPPWPKFFRLLEGPPPPAQEIPPTQD